MCACVHVWEGGLERQAVPYIRPADTHGKTEWAFQHVGIFHI